VFNRSPCNYFSGWFSMVAGAYGIKAIAIDMQKLCVDLFRCSASLNRYNRHEIYHAYATDSKRAALNKKIVMPSKLCVGGTSPGATGSGALSIGLYLCVLCMYVCMWPTLTRIHVTTTTYVHTTPCKYLLQFSIKLDRMYACISSTYIVPKIVFSSYW
jgi:hypothetical protein